MRWLVLGALLFTACGGTDSGGTMPSPTPTPSTITVSGAITDTVTGATVGSFSQSVSGLSALLTITQPGYVTRQTLVGRASPTVDLIHEAAPFDMGFYRQLVRNGLESPTLEPLRLLTASPSVYMQTAGVPAATVTAYEQAVRAVIPALTGGKLSLQAWEAGATVKPDQDGWIVIELIADDTANCGRSLVGAAAGHVWVNTIERCRRNGTIIGSPNLIAHEMGHALGFWHVGASGALMTAVTTTSAVSEAERYHAAIAYKRQPGNRDPDIDAPTATPLRVRQRIVVD